MDALRLRYITLDIIEDSQPEVSNGENNPLQKR